MNILKIIVAILFGVLWLIPLALISRDFIVQLLTVTAPVAPPAEVEEEPAEESKAFKRIRETDTQDRVIIFDITQQK